MQNVLEKSFPKPRMAIFKGSNSSQGFIIAEQDILFEVTDFTIIGGIVALLGSYYVYFVKDPKPVPAYSLLLFYKSTCLNNQRPPCESQPGIRH